MNAEDRAPGEFKSNREFVASFKLEVGAGKIP